MQPSTSLTPLQSGDQQDLYRICQDIELRNYLMEGMEMTMEDCHELILANAAFIKQNPIGLYLIKLGSEVIGYRGFKETYPVSDKIDFMYAIVGEYSGNGIGTKDKCYLSNFKSIVKSA